ncbi:MAG: hypothetical protein AAGC68_11830, partial [Verrucomicrobiota bacterium]
MNIQSPFRCFSWNALLFLLLSASFAFAEPANYPKFVNVLGQPNFSSSGVVDPPTASSLNAPEGIAIDPATGKLFIADAGNNRVLRFSSTSVYETGAAAEAVLGQATFTTKASVLSATSMSFPTGIFIDHLGRLWVADFGNDRVLRFDNAATIASGSPANAVVGQPDLDSNVDPGPTPHSKFDGPVCVIVDKNDALWVSDFRHNRVLSFNNASSLGVDLTADVVLGQ